MILHAIVVVLGAALTIGSAGITGYRCHRWLLQRAPSLGSLLPRDAGALLGLSAGAITVTLWFL